MSDEPPFAGEPEGESAGDEPADEQETQAANALRQALEGRPGGTHLPEPALETAALLRFSSDAGRLSQRRRATLRAELMASLAPARPAQPRTGWRHWLGLGLTLAGGVTAVIVIGVIGARQLSEPAAPQEAQLADERAASATAPATPATAVAPERATSATAEAAGEAAPAEVPAIGAARAEPEARARFAENSAREREPATPVAAAPGAAATGTAKGVAAGAASGAGAPARRGAIVAQVPRAEASRAEARDDEGGGFALGAAAGARTTGADQPAASASAEAKKSQAVPTEQVRRASDQYRSRLLADLADPRIDGAYAESDRAQSKAELEGAQVRLRALAASGLGTSADAERLRPDIYCRLAEVALRLGQPQAALDWARRGLALGAPASPFVARLYLLEGQAKNALGDRDGAARSYLKAIQVNEQLLDESLGDP